MVDGPLIRREILDFLMNLLDPENTHFRLYHQISDENRK